MIEINNMTEYLSNKEHRFIVFQKWIPVDDVLPNHHNKDNHDDDYDYDEQEISIPDSALTEYKIMQSHLKQFAEENNFWDIHTLFPLSEEFLLSISNSPGIEIVALPLTTAYKTRISIAKLFNTTKVQNDISMLAENYVNNNKYLIDMIKNYKRDDNNL